MSNANVKKSGREEGTRLAKEGIAGRFQVRSSNDHGLDPQCTFIKGLMVSMRWYFGGSQRVLGGAGGCCARVQSLRFSLGFRV